ncbi:hypothetical protein [Neobacillus niacini]|nr:hypothetical protein [Neobacillus niacini]
MRDTVYALVKDGTMDEAKITESIKEMERTLFISLIYICRVG